MITPNPTLGSQLYKVGDWVHFAWNYTSLQATPSAINVVASCSKNSATYTIAMNQSVQETGEVFWDTSKYQRDGGSQALLTEQYTLIIYDASGPISQTPKAGYLGSYSGFTFGMYTPEPYTPWSGELKNDMPNSSSPSMTKPWHRFQVSHMQRRHVKHGKDDIVLRLRHGRHNRPDLLLPRHQLKGDIGNPFLFKTHQTHQQRWLSRHHPLALARRSPSFLYIVLFTP
jgi:hypothetical protein